MEWLAYIFRSVNSHIITTQTVWVRKFLKVFFLLTTKVRRFQKLGGPSSFYTISNFDSDLKLKIDRARSMGASLYWTGFHEMRELIFLNRFLKADMVALDVGANLGEYTVFMAKRLRKGKVISFEPLKKNLVLLEENVKLNRFDNVVISNLGLSDSSEQIEIHELEDEMNEGLATIHLGERKSKMSYPVQLELLDSLVDSFDMKRIDFIKMDIEGAELKALKGSIETIRKFKPLVMVEISDVTYQAAGYSKVDIHHFFKTLQYVPYHVDKNGRLASLSQLPEFGNVIYAPREFRK
jgi:FkbM family methyltransferase